MHVLCNHLLITMEPLTLCILILYDNLLVYVQSVCVCVCIYIVCVCVCVVEMGLLVGKG